MPQLASDSNPFSTRFTRPGRIAFEFAGTIADAAASTESRTIGSLEAFLSRWRSLGRRGAIIGPHGSGKSTLVEQVLTQFAGEGIRTHIARLHDGERALPAEIRANAWRANDVVIVDGYEQLAWWARLRLRFAVRRAGCGLLLTAHAATAYPTIVKTAPRREILNALVRTLLAEDEDSLRMFSQQDLDEAWEQTRHNVRETLFRLYDLYETRRTLPEYRAANARS